MNNLELFDALTMLAKEKGIEPSVLIDKIQTALLNAIKKEHPRSENIKFDIDLEKGKFDVAILKEVTDNVEDEANQITPEAAKKYYAKSKTPKIGDICVIHLDTKLFGRIAVQNAKQLIKQSIKEVERNQLIEQWGNLQNEAISATVLKIEPDSGNVMLDINKNEVTLFKGDQIPGEVIKTGDIIKVYVSGVSANDRRPTLKLSRTHKDLIKRLFEIEVPEIHDGIVEIKAISREAGSRSKMAVISNDENVDAVGSCIGPTRSRVTSICNELCGEKIDIVNYSDDPKEFVKQALKPAEVINVEIPDENQRVCIVTVPDNQLSLAIGNKGQNAKLAARLTGYKIDIKPESGFFEG